MTSALERLDDLTVRLYLAAIVGPSRAPFGSRGQASLGVGQSVEITSNTTADRVLFVTVTRADVGNVIGANVIFSQNSGGGGLNDFGVNFISTGIFRFTIKPGESLSLAVTGAVGVIPFVFAVETF